MGSSVHIESFSQRWPSSHTMIVDLADMVERKGSQTVANYNNALDGWVPYVIVRSQYFHDCMSYMIPRWVSRYLPKLNDMEQ